MPASVRPEQNENLGARRSPPMAGILTRLKAAVKARLAGSWVLGYDLTLDSPEYEYVERAAHLSRVMGFLANNGLEGDILQFGVSSGGSLAILDRVSRRWLGASRVEYRIYGFDSFQGLPEPKEIDRAVHSEAATKAVSFRQGAYAASKAEVVQKLRERGADLRRIHLVEGWYDRVLTDELRESLGLRRAILIDIDCDFYESSAVALEWCRPLIRQGTIITFDDWFCYEGRPDHGEQRAFAEFLDRNRHLEAAVFGSYSWHGRSFLVSEKARRGEEVSSALPAG